MSAAMSKREQNARHFMAAAATLAALGVATNLDGGDSTLPKLIAGAGLITLIWSIHRFGRLGPQEPIVFSAPEPEAPRKKKKKKKRPAEEAETKPDDAKPDDAS
ncbi:MAG TPA: hypothetical protein VJN18_08195 [Polyangiaceae bacterium]|nr:hypothetical protein [Polyangiaceae bacterium]